MSNLMPIDTSVHYIVETSFKDTGDWYVWTNRTFDTVSAAFHAYSDHLLDLAKKNPDGASRVIALFEARYIRVETFKFVEEV